ncbi:MAG: hypothetical protein IPF99_23110 [Deltaproteobacteria bacterium]|nr:hypothetical protein [Deltaproteobacteria bacterium]
MATSRGFGQWLCVLAFTVGACSARGGSGNPLGFGDASTTSDQPVATGDEGTVLPGEDVPPVGEDVPPVGEDVPRWARTSPGGRGCSPGHPRHGSVLRLAQRGVL